MSEFFRTVLAGETATRQLAAQLAGLAHPGDLIALEGDLGAGKSTFARAFIRAAADDPGLDVPSPTFTLVQTYEAASGLPIIHTDLYRLAGPDDVADLGLEDEMPEAVTLAEWPDRLADDWRAKALFVRLGFTPDDAKGKRALSLASDQPAWRDRLHPLLAPTDAE